MIENWRYSLTLEVKYLRNLRINLKNFVIAAMLFFAFFLFYKLIEIMDYPSWKMTKDLVSDAFFKGNFFEFEEEVFIGRVFENNKYRKVIWYNVWIPGELAYIYSCLFTWIYASFRLLKFIEEGKNLFFTVLPTVGVFACFFTMKNIVTPLDFAIIFGVSFLFVGLLVFVLKSPKKNN